MLSQPLIRISSHPLNCSPVKITSLSFVHTPLKSDRRWKPAPLQILRPGTRGRRGEGRKRMACTIGAFFSMAYGLPLQVPPIRLRSAALLRFKIHEHRLHLFHPSGTEGLRLSTLPTDDHAERQPNASQRSPLRFLPINFKDEMRSPETPFASHGVAEDDQAK